MTAKICIVPSMFARCMLWLTLAVAVIAGCGPAASAARAQTAAPVASLDENRLLGNWFEIARLPDKKEKLCASDAVKLIARWEKPGTLEWVDGCTVKQHFNDARTTYAHPVPKRKQQEQATGVGRYRVYTIWPLSRKYDVLGIANDNSWLMIGSPNHKNLRLYAKARTMTPNVYSAAQQVATTQGYDVTKLIAQPQNAPASTAQGEMAAAPTP